MDGFTHPHRTRQVAPARGRIPSDRARLVMPRGRVTNKISDFKVQPPEERSNNEIVVIKAEPVAKPALHRQQHSLVLKRQITAQQQPTVLASDKSFLPRNPLSKIQMSLVFMALLVFSLGIIVTIETFLTNRDAKTQVAALSKSVDAKNVDGTATTDAPSETPPSRSAQGYQVAPNQPKFIDIPKYTVHARVRPVGVSTTNELKAPSNIFDAGWYDASAHPGDGPGNGAVLLDGHVHGPTLPGVFVNIKKLVPGDTIQITRGDNTIITYHVVKVQLYDADKLDMGMMLTSAQPGKHALNLITCGGTYDHKSGEYLQRTAVFAVQQS